MIYKPRTARLLARNGPLLVQLLMTVFNFSLLDSPVGTANKPSYNPHIPPVLIPNKYTTLSLGELTRIETVTLRANNYTNM